MQTTWVLLLATGLGLLYLSKWFLHAKHDPKEPPIISPKFPLVGHVIGMMREKSDYYLNLSKRYNLPIYTIFLPGTKFYVVNTIELIGAIQRQPKTFAFPPLEAKAAMIVCDSSKEANDILKTNVNGEEGDWGYWVDFYRSMHTALAPGQGLDGMNRVMIQNIAASIDKLRAPRKGEATRIKVMEWFQHELTLATTNAVYGHMNPFQDPKIEKAFWELANDIVMILMNFLPSLIAAKACRGREIVSQAFLEYFRNKGHENGSALVNIRHLVSTKNKIPLADIARYEVGGSIAILINTSPALFWMVFYVFSQPNVLKDCRAEIANIMTTKRKSDGTLVRSLDITDMKSKCPTVVSTFQEVLRLTAFGTSVRQVTEDAILDNRYLLKKDNLVMMPSIVVHNDPEVWGPDFESFNHRRFLKEKTLSNNQPTESGKRKPVNSAAFRGFGGGTTLCPGRHFATTEILAVIAMLCMRYEIRPRADRWTAPSTSSTNMAATILEPDTDIEVDVTMREGFEDGEWTFELTGESTASASALALNGPE